MERAVTRIDSHCEQNVLISRFCSATRVVAVPVKPLMTSMFGAESFVHNQRQVVPGRTRPRGAGFQRLLRLDDILDRFETRKSHHHADRHADAGRADPTELAEVDFDSRIAERVLNHQRVVEHHHRQTVAVCLPVYIVGRDQASRAFHVFDGGTGIAGDVFADVPGDCPQVRVIAAARRQPDDEADGFAFVKIVGRYARGPERKQTGQQHECAQYHKFYSLPDCRSVVARNGAPNRPPSLTLFGQKRFHLGDNLGRLARDLLGQLFQLIGA
jgi:hypothetical protein